MGTGDYDDMARRYWLTLGFEEVKIVEAYMQVSVINSGNFWSGMPFLSKEYIGN